jgi:hypothetical protein
MKTEADALKATKNVLINGDLRAMSARPDMNMRKGEDPGLSNKKCTEKCQNENKKCALE